MILARTTIIIELRSFDWRKLLLLLLVISCVTTIQVKRRSYSNIVRNTLSITLRAVNKIIASCLPYPVRNIRPQKWFKPHFWSNRPKSAYFMLTFQPWKTLTGKKSYNTTILYIFPTHTQVQCAHAFMLSDHVTLLWISCAASTVLAIVSVYYVTEDRIEKVHVMQVIIKKHFKGHDFINEIPKL